ncbi:hypothetical protein OROGR_014505 [Orobanche gracilis]
MGDCRRIGVAVDFSPCSRKALRWAVENVARNGDHLILVTVRPEGYYEAGEMQLWETTGSPLIPLSDFSNPQVMKKYEVQPDLETLDIVSTASRRFKSTQFRSRNLKILQSEYDIIIPTSDDRRGLSDRSPVDRGIGDRTFATQYLGDCTPGDRASSDRKTRDRTLGDRTSGDRKTRDRTSGDRASGDRKLTGRISVDSSRICHVTTSKSTVQEQKGPAR